MISSIGKRSTDSLMDCAQVLFCKAPEKGKTKTRLAADYSGAVDFYAALLDQTISNLSADPVIPLYLFVDPHGLPYFQERFPGISVVAQDGRDLGERMARAFQYMFEREGASRVVIAGSDVPGYSSRERDAILTQLEHAAVVLQRSSDGGYSAIGMGSGLSAESIADCFVGIEWSTSEVYEVQLNRFLRAGVSVFSMPEELNDVDTLEDLLWFRKQADDATASFLNAVPRVVAILPVLNEEDSLPAVLPPLLESAWISEVICVDNGSTDRSAKIIQEMGASLLQCKERGYGAAMLTGIASVIRRKFPGKTILIFLDADGSDDSSAIPDLLAPIFRDEVDFVLGARQGALLKHQRMGNDIAVRLIDLFWEHRFRDLGPFRAIRLDALNLLEMDDRNFGWTIQMQIRALVKHLRILELPVVYHPRFAGKSKVSGTIRGTVLAGTIILRTIFNELFRGRKRFTLSE